MGRPRSPNRDKARELWEQSGGTLSNREIAAQLAEDEKVIAVWKQRDGWLKSNVVQHSECVVQQTPKRLNQKLIRAVEQNEDLTEKEKAFCLHWVKSFNATAATIAAAYDTKYPNRVGWELLQKPHIQAEIKRLKEIRNMDMLGAAEDVLALHWRIAFGDVGDFVDWGRVEVPVMSAFGPVEVEVEDPQTKQKHKVALTREVNDVRFRESTQVDTQLVSKVKIGRDGASIELRSADKSMAFLERYFTMNPMDKHKKAFDEAKLALEAKSQGASSGGGSVIIPDSVWRDLMNPAYADHLTDERQTQVFFGGSSSGKSFAILGQRVVRDIMRGDRNYLICRKTARTLRNSCFNEVKKCISRMELADQFNINKSDMVITHKSTGRQILFAGLDDVEKVKSLTPAEGVLTDVLIEEATEIDYADYKQLRKRLRGGEAGVSKRVTLLFNPVTQDHWIYTEFFAGRWDDERGEYSDQVLLVKRTTYKDNRFLTAEDIAALENETDKYYYDVYTLGKWGVLGKLIFTNWTTKDLSGMAAKEAKARNGLDFGFWPDPNAYVRCGYNRGKGEVYIYRTGGGNYQDNAALAAMLRPIVNREVVRCDNEPRDIHELNNFGINAIPAQKGPGSVEFGLKWLQRQKIFVDPSCTDIILELQKYKYKEDRNGKVLPEPVDRDNHWIDGLRYALEDDMLETRVS